MAKVAAARLAGDEAAAYAGSVTSTKLKVTGIDVFSAGDFAERPRIARRSCCATPRAASTSASSSRTTASSARCSTARPPTAPGSSTSDEAARDVAELRETLIFGQAYAGGAPLDPRAAVAALPDDAEICGCNGVCKGKIVQAIAGKGLGSLDEVRAHTKASASCGSCTGLVEKLLALTLGDAYQPDGNASRCAAAPASATTRSAA